MSKFVRPTSTVHEYLHRFAYSTRLGCGTMPPKDISLKTYCVTVLLFSLFFWIWALKNTIAMNAPLFDFGVVSFGASCLSSSYLLAIANLKAKPKSITRLLVFGSHGLVALNYALGIYAGIVYLKRPGFALYCGFFSQLWVAIAIFGNKIACTDSSGPYSTGESTNLVR